MNNQKIYLNQGLSNLENILSILKAKRIFIVCGGNSFLPISKTIKNLLKNFSTSYFRVMNSKPNISSIKSGIKEFDDFNPDIILAIGGGSVIDTAKLIKTLSGCSEKIEILIRKQKELERKERRRQLRKQKLLNKNKNKNKSNSRIVVEYQ